MQVPGLQEQHPPVAQGDEVHIRLSDFPEFQLGCRVVNVIERTVLVLLPSLDRDQILAEGQRLLTAMAMHAHLHRPLGAVGAAREALNALCFHRKRPKLGETQPEEPALCHLRFCLNRTMQVRLPVPSPGNALIAPFPVQETP